MEYKEVGTLREDTNGLCNSFLDNRFSYKKDAVVVDVGINRSENGLKGDALKDLPVALQTPVPGGVGLLTRLALYENLIQICKGEK